MVSVRKLKSVVKKAKMSPDLKRAINATITAMKKRDYEMAYELSAVKSHIATKTRGRKLTRHYHFHEDTAHNQRVLGDDVYGIMDALHHELAYKTGQHPSGLVVLSLAGMREKPKPKRKHPILRLIAKESRASRRAAGLPV